MLGAPISGGAIHINLAWAALSLLGTGDRARAGAPISPCRRPPEPSLARTPRELLSLVSSGRPARW